MRDRTLALCKKPCIQAAVKKMVYHRVRCSLLSWANLPVPLFNNLFTTCILKNLPAHWTTCNHNMLSQQVTPLVRAIKQQFCCLLHQRGLEPFSLMFYIYNYVTIALHDFTEDDSWHSEPVSVRFQSKLE